MDVPARFRWNKREEGGFIAYPVGTTRPGRFITIRLQTSGWNTDSNPHFYRESWHWLVKWDGWFAVSGFAEGKQLAADKATESWWQAIETEIPRDVDLEVTMVAARVLVRPPPNSLFAEDTGFLTSVIWHLNDIYRHQIKAGQAPDQVSSLITRLSEELYRRRLDGEASPDNSRRLS